MWPADWRRVGDVMAAMVALTATAAWSADAPTTSPAGDSTKADISRPGAYCSGQWKYRLTVTAPGSKSEGTRGELFFGGKPVEEPATGDYYHTPWGDVQWVGNSALLWGAHGWMLRTPKSGGGRVLAEPWIETGAPVVMTMVLNAAAAPPAGIRIEPWVKAGMQKLGVKGFRVARPWFPLNDQAVTIHDTKMLGTLTARLSPPRDADALTVILDGSKTECLELPRKDGATKLILRRLGDALAAENFYLALRVDRAAPAWPRPMDIGLESAGKEVVVQGTREIVIRLPGDKRSGRVWVIKRVQGDAPAAASVQASGEPQFSPAAGANAGAAGNGAFENILRVAGVGKSYVELEYKRTWQTDQPAEKTFSVTLDVREAPGAVRPKP